MYLSIYVILYTLDIGVGFFSVYKLEIFGNIGNISNEWWQREHFKSLNFIRITKHKRIHPLFNQMIMHMHTHTHTSAFVAVINLQLWNQLSLTPMRPVGITDLIYSMDWFKAPSTVAHLSLWKCFHCLHSVMVGLGSCPCCFHHSLPS